MYRLMSSIFNDPAGPPLSQIQDATVAALLKAGHVALAECLDYELKAAQGHSVTSHFNRAAGGDLDGLIDARRRETARESIRDMREEAAKLLDDDRKNDGGGGGPGSVAGPEIESAKSDFAAATQPAAEQDNVPLVPAVSTTRMPESNVPRPPWGKLLGGK